MITLPSGLNSFMQGQNLTGLKPFALLYRNKWDSDKNVYELEQPPIDISDLIAKPNTLSMTLDVNEVAQYNANNVTLTLSDTKNYFVEGTPNSYFPDGYQIYGSRIVLYYGTDGVNRTPLFTGVIKDLPTHKPENYQVDVKLVSPLEMLKDIEAKDFSDKVTGETLTYKSTDSDGHRIYWTTGTGVGGFDAVYADGTKLFEGVDYETDQLNALGLPAIVTIINSDYYSSTITADYYTWKTGLTVEQIVAGLVGLAGYTSGTEDIRNVVWSSGVRTPVSVNLLASVGYKQSGNNFLITGDEEFFTSEFPTNTTSNFKRYSLFPENFEISFKIGFSGNYPFNLYPLYYCIGETDGTTIGDNVLGVFAVRTGDYNFVSVRKRTNGTWSDYVRIGAAHEPLTVTIRKIGNNIVFSSNEGSATYDVSTFDFCNTNEYNEFLTFFSYQGRTAYFTDFSLSLIDNNGVVQNTIRWAGVIADWQNLTEEKIAGIGGSLSSDSSTYTLQYRYLDNGSFTVWNDFSFEGNLGITTTNLQLVVSIANALSDIIALCVYQIGSSLNLQLVNLSGLTVLEALQDFALISGYEFGVDRQGVFFFRPRVSSTTPTYILDHDEIVKVDTVKKNLSDFFTKLTLTFAQVPLEFYANTGDRPNLVDKYGIINKEIDKPDIVNYDNPELAQAIGPQLLEVYSALPNIIKVTGKLNLALELGDIVSLRRNMNLITPEGYTDYSKYEALNTYYRACKITGMNYNFARSQMTYTLRDVSNKNTEPQYEFDEYIYEHQLQFGVKE